MNKKLTFEFDFKFDMILLTHHISSPTVEYRCRAVRWCAWTRGIGTKESRKRT